MNEILCVIRWIRGSNVTPVSKEAVSRFRLLEGADRGSCWQTSVCITGRMGGEPMKHCTGHVYHWQLSVCAVIVERSSADSCLSEQLHAFSCPLVSKQVSLNETQWASVNTRRKEDDKCCVVMFAHNTLVELCSQGGVMCSLRHSSYCTR